MFKSFKILEDLPAEEKGSGLILPIVEGYIAVWNKYPPDEIKIRVARPSVLGPSKALFEDMKAGRITLAQFEERFVEEIESNPQAQEKLDEIQKLAKKQVVRLLCYEKNPPCHRFILIDMLRERSTGF